MTRDKAHQQAQSTSLHLHLASKLASGVAVQCMFVIANRNGWRAHQQTHTIGRHMSQGVHASLHHGAQHGRSAARRERLQSVLAYSCLGVCQEDVDGVAGCNLFADWSGLDLVHVCCKTPSSVRSRKPDATAPSRVINKQAWPATPSRLPKCCKSSTDTLFALQNNTDLRND